MSNRLKLKVKTKIPAALLGGIGTVITKDGITYKVELDYSRLQDVGNTFDPNYVVVAIWNPHTGDWARVSLTNFINGSLSPAAFDIIAPTTTEGDMIVREGGHNVRLPVGQAGYALLSNGTDPIYDGFLQSGTGAAKRTWQDKARETVSVKDFGAVGNGVADDTSAFQNAIAALPGGGRIYVPRGFYRITATLTLHGGLTFYGDTCVTNVFGLPTGNETPSHVFIDSDTLALFQNVSGVSMEGVSFTDITFAARLTPSVTPRGTATGFNLSGSAPSDIKNLNFNHCQFTNFGGYAIRVRDPLAPGANPDWNVCPATLSDCTFYYNAVGISFETDNADFWQLNGTAFFQGTGMYGIICQRSGVLVLNQCFGGGGIMLITGGSGPQDRDSITFIACQFEQGTAMLQVADNMSTQRTYRPIKMISCVVESPILLSASCHFISEGSRYVNNIEVTASGVLIDSYSDSFLPTTAINLVAGSSVRNYVTHGTDYPIGVRGPIIDGKCIRTASAAPVGGSVAYVAGDITYNSSPSTGSPMGWICLTSGTPGTWDILGQIGFRVHAGSPVGAVVPNFLGEELLDNTTAKWWKSIDVGINNWVALN
ncbi:glycosyl hydrolase family 28-related protein [Bradyrhizobium sp. C9]|uniref:glycosyl hydrolase family 28-related protein n=1 Tax=Bradyrhizobium sp. C9 TaxID=142585 RepID=UPI000BE97577|nr:glycosyl hydrolase family 28-related protein [Bradyrhizobium sp. C9]PDT74117.1 hypothetical protein CO675_26975 [Bradyrhizobium sp. C9]